MNYRKNTFAFSQSFVTDYQAPIGLDGTKQICFPLVLRTNRKAREVDRV
jgi:hypothetical protein